MNLSTSTVTLIVNRNSLQLRILSFIADIAYPYIITPISSLGFILNLISLLVFFRLLSNGNIYKFFLIKAITDSILLLIGSFIVYGTCGNCASFQTLGSVIYRHFFSGFINSAMSTFSGFCEILIAVDRIYIVKNKKLNSWFYIFFIILSLSISFLIPVPFFFANKIENIGDSKYILRRTKFGTSIEYTYYLSSVLIILNSFLFSCLVVSNTILLVQFKKYISKKSNLTSILVASTESGKSKDSRNNYSSNSSKTKDGATKSLTKMVLFLSIFFIITRLIHSISTILTSINRLKKINFDAFSVIISICSLILNYIMFGSTLIYHSCFNKIFFQSFKRLFFYKK